MTYTTIPINGWSKVEVLSYGTSVELCVSDGDSRYAEVMLDETEARQVAAALLAPWDKS